MNNQIPERAESDPSHTIADGAQNGPNIGAEDLKRFLEDYEVERIRKEFTSRMITLFIASLGLVTALAWDDVLRQLFSDIFHARGSTGERLYYAITLTFLATAISVTLGRLFLKKKKEKE